MSASSLRRSSARNGSTKSGPAISISPLLTSIREIASRSLRLSAATKTRGFRFHNLEQAALVVCGR